MGSAGSTGTAGGGGGRTIIYTKQANGITKTYMFTVPESAVKSGVTPSDSEKENLWMTYDSNGQRYKSLTDRGLSASQAFADMYSNEITKVTEDTSKTAEEIARAKAQAEENARAKAQAEAEAKAAVAQAEENARAKAQAEAEAKAAKIRSESAARVGQEEDWDSKIASAAAALSTANRAYAVPNATAATGGQSVLRKAARSIKIGSSGSSGINTIVF